jgi:hypothetical protein
MLNLLKSFLPKPKPVTKVWLIDPVKRSVAEIENHHIPSLVSETVGDDAECYKLDNHDNVVWLSDTDTNKRYAYYFEGMDFPFDVRRYSKAIVISLGPNFWDIDTIESYLRFFDKQNIYGDV